MVSLQNGFIYYSPMALSSYNSISTFAYKSNAYANFAGVNTLHRTGERTAHVSCEEIQIDAKACTRPGQEQIQTILFLK
jgi:hypothetical protein